MFDAVAHFTKYKDHKESRPPLLIGIESLMERLQGVSEFPKIGCSLNQGVGVPMQEFDRVAVAQGFEITITEFPHSFCRGCYAGLPVLRPSANGVFYSWPVLFLVGRHLQRGFYDINPRIS